MRVGAIRLQRRGLQLLPEVSFTGEGRSIEIAMAAFDAVEPILDLLRRSFEREVAECTCDNGSHSLIVSVGAIRFANLGIIYFVVSSD